MSGSAVAAMVPLLYLLLVLATDVWVYADAQAQYRRGTPVLLTLGAFSVDPPAAWVVCCLLFWIVFVPRYVVARGRWS
jgi:hypothetical protein